MEAEHQKIITTKMKLAVHEKLHPEAVDIANGKKDVGLNTSENILMPEMNKQSSSLNFRNEKVLQVRSATYFILTFLVLSYITLIYHVVPINDV